MKKLTVYFVVLSIFMAMSKPVFAVTSLDNLGNEIQYKVNEQIKSTIGNNKLFGTFSDPEYKNYSNQFALGQKVYVRISVAFCNNEQKVVRLLDSVKNEIMTTKLTKDSDSPCVLSVSFDAPNKDGIYYLDVKINDSSGSSFAGQMNINVGKGGSYVSTSVENKIVTGKIGSPTSIVTVTVTPIKTPMITFVPKGNDIQSISSILNEFFRKIIAIFTKNK